MPEDKLIDPAWLVRARKARRTLVYRVVLVFAVLSILAWWALPRLEARSEEIRGAVGWRSTHPRTDPSSVRWLLYLAGGFKVLWAGIALGGAAAVVLAISGKIDTFVPVLNIAVLLVGAGALGLTFYAFYAPTLLALEAVR